MEVYVCASTCLKASSITELDKRVFIPGNTTGTITARTTILNVALVDMNEDIHNVYCDKNNTKKNIIVDCSQSYFKKDKKVAANQNPLNFISQYNTLAIQLSLCEQPLIPGLGRSAKRGCVILWSVPQSDAHP